MPEPTKSEQTKRRIVEVALETFRSQGFDAATIRAIASRAGIAAGGIYYYYESKEAIILDVYRIFSVDLDRIAGELLASPGGFEETLAKLLHGKFEYLAPNRNVLRALLRNGADPAHPLSPFSEATRETRDAEIARFARLLEVTKVKLPPDLAPHMPSALWLYFMGLVLFWITDDSKDQSRTRRLVDRSASLVAGLIRLSTLPLTRPLRKPVIELIEIVKGA